MLVPGLLTVKTTEEGSIPQPDRVLSKSYKHARTPVTHACAQPPLAHTHTYTQNANKQRLECSVWSSITWQLINYKLNGSPVCSRGLFHVRAPVCRIFIKVTAGVRDSGGLQHNHLLTNGLHSHGSLSHTAQHNTAPKRTALRSAAPQPPQSHRYIGKVAVWSEGEVDEIFPRMPPEFQSPPEQVVQILWFRSNHWRRRQ